MLAAALLSPLPIVAIFDGLIIALLLISQCFYVVHRMNVGQHPMQACAKTLASIV